MKNALLLLLAATTGAAAFAADQPATEKSADAGYVTLAVKGMHCQMCASSVRGFLKKVDGVESSHVDVASGTVLVKLLPGKTVDDATLKKAVFDAGFEATGVSRSSDDYAKAVEALKAREAAKPAEKK